jgi:hypothetical protein
MMDSCQLSLICKECLTLIDISKSISSILVMSARYKVPDKTSTSRLKGALVRLKGIPVDQKGQLVWLKGDLIDQKGELVWLKGDPVDQKDEPVRLKGDLVDQKGELVR